LPVLHTYLRKRLAEEFPDADEDTLADTLEGLSNLPDQLAAVVRSALDDESLVEALRRRMGEMRERAGRLARRVETKRRLVTETMARAELKRVEREDFTVSLRPPRPALVIVDEAEIPDQFWKPGSPKLDRRGLTDYLREGGQTCGACLDNGSPSISVRTR
jgi:hypothetical protein